MSLYSPLFKRVSGAIIVGGLVGTFLGQMTGDTPPSDVDSHDHAATASQNEVAGQLAHEHANPVVDIETLENGIILEACMKDGKKVTMAAVITGDIIKGGKIQPLHDFIQSIFTEAARSHNSTDKTWLKDLAEAYVNSTTGNDVKMNESYRAELMPPIVSGDNCAPK